LFYTLHLEALANLLRLGGLYWTAPQHYAIGDDIDDQQQLDYMLLCYAVAYGFLARQHSHIW